MAFFFLAVAVVFVVFVVPRIASALLKLWKANPADYMKDGDWQ